MLKLHQFDYFNGKNLSPFCHKVEIYLQLTKQPYEVVPTLSHKAPRGKLPYLVDREKIIPDSGEIIEYLKHSYGDPLDQKLTPAAHAQGHLLRRVCEESLYFVIIYNRWVDPEYWPQTKAALFSNLPPVIKNIVPALVQKSVKKSLNGQGYGKHTREQIYHLGQQDLQAIATMLEQAAFAVSDAPTSYDASVFAFVNSIINGTDSPLKRAALEHPSLIRYAEQMKQQLGL